jgi:hypothetical protein
VTGGRTALAVALAALALLAAIVIVVVLTREEEPAAPELEPQVQRAIEQVPEWGAFEGAPEEIAAPPGGDAELVERPDGTRELRVTREDGAPAAQVTFGPDGRPAEARIFDEDGELTLVVSGVRARPGPKRAGGAGASAALRVRCGSGARRNAGWRFARFPADWKLKTSSVPRALLRQGALRSLRLARSTWNANKSHCRGLPDRSRLRFRYTGGTRRSVGRNGLSTVGFGDTARLGGVCAGTVACTLTWLGAGNRVLESDTRFNARIRGGFSTRRRTGAFDLQSIMTHELGHSLGVEHVSANVSARRLGRGDALINNSKY